MSLELMAAFGRLMNGFYGFRCWVVALELGLIAAIGERPDSATALAARTNLDSRAVARLLDALVALHLTRLVGVAFLTLYLAGRLPATFALPGGIGGIVVALAAGLALIAWMPTRTVRQRWFLLAWNMVGLLDIVAVVITALIIGSHAEIFRRLARVPVHEQQTWKGRTG